MSHTPEPWILFEVGDRFKHQCPASSDRTSILTTAMEDDVQFGAVYNDEDAKRIVACVNACAGMRNDELEGGLLLGVMSKKIERLEAERLELIKALESFLDLVGDSHGVSGYHLNGDIAEWDEFECVGEAYELIKRIEGIKKQPEAD